MYFSLQEILRNPECKRINLYDNDIIVYKCGYVFKKNKKYKNDRWELMNLNKKDNNGYIGFELTNNNKQTRRFKLHRIIYYAFNQERFDIYDSLMNNSIDHKNGYRADNRLSNLRNVTNKHNTFNRTKAKGYCFDKQSNKYKAEITIDGKGKHLGLFKTKTGARLKYLRTKEILHKITEL